MHIHHIGYLVENLEEAVKEFQYLGYKILSKEIIDSIREFKVIYMEKDGYCIELVSPITFNSEIYSLLQRYKNAPYHICYEFEEDLNEIVTDFLERGAYYLTVEPYEIPKEALCIMKKPKVAFIVNSKIGILELLGY